jgi:toxin YoeB
MVAKQLRSLMICGISVYTVKLKTKKAQEHFDFLKKNQPAAFKKLRNLYEELKLHPYYGTGKPEPLKHELSGLWSRRINHEHRVVYEVDESQNIVFILSCKDHY